ncbi:MAG: DUF819 family protein [Vicinamibacterales bacterium]
MISDPTALMAFLFGLIAASRWLERVVPAVQRISSAVVCTLAGIVLANVGVIPHASPVFDAVNTYAVPYAIVLVILGSDIRDLGTAGRAMLLAFAAATVGSFAGALIAGVLFETRLGADTWKLAGQFAGSFVGGGMNFVAVGRGLATEPSLFAAASVVNNLSTVPWMLAQMALFGVLAPYYRADTSAGDAEEAERQSARIRDQWSHADLSITAMAVLAALPLAIMWVSGLLAPLLPGFPLVLWQTTLALVVAQVPAVRRVPGATVLSYFALHLFFVVIGTSSIISELASSWFPLLAFMLTIIAIHAVIAYGVGWLAGVDLATVTVASQAAVGGPGSALALAMSMKWPAQVTPGIIVGIFGYAIGNYIGFSCAWATRALMGGGG